MAPCVQVQLADGTTLPPLDFAPCSGHGQCVDNGTALARCVCDDGWTGAGDLIGPALQHVDCHLSVDIMRGLWVPALLQAIAGLVASYRVQRTLLFNKTHRKVPLCHKSRVYLTVSQVALAAAALGFGATCVIKLVEPEQALGTDSLINAVEVAALMAFAIGLFAWLFHLCTFMLKQATMFKGVKVALSIKRIQSLSLVLMPLTLCAFSFHALIPFFPMHARVLASAVIVFAGALTWAFAAWVLLPMVIRPIAAELERVLDLHERQMRNRATAGEPSAESAGKVEKIRAFRRKCLTYVWVSQALTSVQLVLAIALVAHPVGYFFYGIIHPISQFNAAGAITSAQFVLLQERESTLVGSRSGKSSRAMSKTPVVHSAELGSSSARPNSKSKLSTATAGVGAADARVCDHE